MEFKKGDRVLVTDLSSPLHGYEGTVTLAWPNSESYAPYSVEFPWSGYSLGFKGDQLELVKTSQRGANASETASTDVVSGGRSDGGGRRPPTP